MWIPLITLISIIQTTFALSSHIIQLHSGQSFGEISQQGSGSDSSSGLFDFLKPNENNTIEIGDFKALIAEFEEDLLENLKKIPFINQIFPNSEFKLFDVQADRYSEGLEKRYRILERSRSPSTFYKRDDGITIQEDAPRHLARLSQREGIFNESGPFEYRYKETGKDITVYVVDSGISTEHPDFEGRATLGKNIAGGGSQNKSSDLTGHGTNVAGIIGSKTYGVAKEAKLIDVKVIGAYGTTSISSILRGIEWANNDRKSKNLTAVANLSLGGPQSDALDQAVQAAFNDGLAIVAAAGNSNANATDYSPARLDDIITVGALDDFTDTIAPFSNYGSPVDIFASGVKVESLNNNITGPPSEFYGTSQAAPSITGIVALLLEQGVSKDDLKDRLIELSTKNAISEETYEENQIYDNTVNRVGYNGVEDTDDEIDNPSTKKPNLSLLRYVS
ncbi:putative secreted protein [Wickerhamomyces ciferrii]|uniref:Secreted protein n=1 Tax=Wickerhamomyces ciferrii (strain ATCC 14091 / BCRC 22168 / CBS 111 / JCM 3599 / NBRC 0793 / NRRL Y-1031 F-60-10) TaxID=1206466 RepID=K0KCE9_WICCF|nr:uncharacterized protein BN7_2294 [Wickerhamomyces ciferrii]CCH42750.1 putative secreted protein [Wickerhamomyces ciferrii]